MTQRAEASSGSFFPSAEPSARTMEVSRGRLQRHPSRGAVGAGPIVSPSRRTLGHRPDRAGHLSPRRPPRGKPGQMQHDAPHRALDPRGELDQPLAQRADLRVGTGGALRLSLQGLEQDVRGERQEHPELIGQEPMATRPVHRQARDAAP